MVGVQVGWRWCGERGWPFRDQERVLVGLTCTGSQKVRAENLLTDNKGSGERAGQIWPAGEDQRVKQRGRQQSSGQTDHSSRTSLLQHGANVHEG